MAAALTLTLGSVGCQNKNAGNETPAATTEEVRTTEAVTTAAPTTEAPTTTAAPVSTTAQPTSVEETEEEKKLLSISEANFPDAAFRAYVAEQLDQDRDGALSEAELTAVVSVDVSNKGIADLKGIEYFTNIFYLDCSQNRLEKVDVSQHLALYTLMCYNNQLTNLDVSKNLKLEHLYCSNNQLESLDFTANISLKDIYCHQNQLKSLKVAPEGEWIGITVDPGVDISRNENTYTTTVLTNDMVVKIDPVTGAVTYPDGMYSCEGIGAGQELYRKEAEGRAQGWCTSTKIENGYLYIDGYMSCYLDTGDHEGQIWYLGDGHICLPLAEDVKYYSPGDPALGFQEKYYPLEEFNEDLGPYTFIDIENGVVTRLSKSA